MLKVFTTYIQSLMSRMPLFVTPPLSVGGVEFGFIPMLVRYIRECLVSIIHINDGIKEPIHWTSVSRWENFCSPLATIQVDTILNNIEALVIFSRYDGLCLVYKYTNKSTHWRLSISSSHVWKCNFPDGIQVGLDECEHDMWQLEGNITILCCYRKPSTLLSNSTLYWINR